MRIGRTAVSQAGTAWSGGGTRQGQGRPDRNRPAARDARRAAREGVPVGIGMRVVGERVVPGLISVAPPPVRGDRRAATVPVPIVIPCPVRPRIARPQTARPTIARTRIVRPTLV